LPSQGQKHIYRIADIVFSIEVNAKLSLHLGELFSKFQIRAFPPDVRFRLHLLPSCAESPPKSPLRKEAFKQSVVFFFDESSPFFDVKDVQQKLQEALENPEQVVLEVRKSSMLIVNIARRQLDLFYDQSVLWPQCIVRPRILALFLPSFSAFMVHSAAVLRGGKAALFPACDGGGKSTAAGLAPCDSVLSDDQNIVRIVDHKARVFPAPWGKTTNAGHHGELGAVFLLEKDHSFSITEAKRREVVQFLWNENSPYWSFMPKEERIRSFEIIMKALRSVPTYRMRFSKDYVDWEAVDRAMEKG
jgi:hypothetical protein